ncbi:MAG TPA: hypothetical protein VMS76_13190 [Planctomycetota bacterium]|nr:hypothetical protein [Planctomycetota bacterium]
MTSGALEILDASPHVLGRHLAAGEVLELANLLWTVWAEPVRLACEGG